MRSPAGTGDSGVRHGPRAREARGRTTWVISGAAIIILLARTSATRPASAPKISQRGRRADAGIFRAIHFDHVPRRCAAQYVPRTQRAPDARRRRRRRPPGPPAGQRRVPPGSGPDAAGAEVGEPAVQVRPGAVGGQVGLRPGQRLPAGHQAGAEAVLQRGHRVPPPGPPGRHDQRGARREPAQSDRDLRGGEGGRQPVRREERDVRGHERQREAVRNGRLSRRVQVQGDAAAQQLQRLRVVGL